MNHSSLTEKPMIDDVDKERFIRILFWFPINGFLFSLSSSSNFSGSCVLTLQTHPREGFHESQDYILVTQPDFKGAFQDWERELIRHKGWTELISDLKEGSWRREDNKRISTSGSAQSFGFLIIMEMKSK